MIPDYTQELEDRVKANADALVAIGLKEWRKKRKLKTLVKEKAMTEMEQEETLRRIEAEITEKSRNG